MASVDYPKDFYLGRIFDHNSADTTDDPYLYDPDDLTTHAVVVGMTGSGKTGLCLDLMEEAALHNLPAILIDPKGDITNLLLHFPELLPSDFEPWINADNARREGKSVSEVAASTADLWKNGLAGWGIESDRIQRLKDSAYRTIYTPGSTSGKPISILASLSAPDLAWDEHQETLLEQIEGTVTALLSLIGITDADPVSDPRHILLSNIMSNAWQKGQNIDMGELIMQVTNPPFEKIGFFPVDQFFPSKDRMALAMKLNSILAAPSFQPWITGEALDIQSLFYAPDGKPRHSIFYIAHLSESERMFIVTLLYSAIETWMRSQRGTNSLRALVYFDEIFGYLPPSANPPSKKPMLRMLKQARAFGLGMVLATQNPVDIDYKGLSNAGTWFVGRLQTERDKERLLDGLQGAAGGEFDRKTADRMLSGLGKRVFLVNNVHDRGGPKLFQTRWAMNYLAGPMTRTQIKDLNALSSQPDGAAAPTRSTSSRSARAAAPVAAAAAAPAARESSALDGYTQTRPAVPQALDEFFIPRKYSLAKAVEIAGMDSADVKSLGMIYKPGLLAQADVRFTDRKGSFDEYRRMMSFIPDPPERGRTPFGDFEVEPIDPNDLDPDAEPDARFGELDAILGDARKVKSLEKDFVDHIYRVATLNLFANNNTKLKMVSQPGESREDFRERVEAEADKYEDAEIDKIKKSFDTKLDRLKERLRKEKVELEQDKSDLKNRKMEEMVKHGETIMKVASIFMGGSSRRSSGVSTSMTKRRMTAKAASAVDETEAQIEALKQQLEDLTHQQEDEMLAIDQKWAEIVDEIEEMSVSPMKKNISVELFGVGWQPHWLVEVDGRVRELPAAY